MHTASAKECTGIGAARRRLILLSMFLTGLVLGCLLAGLLGIRLELLPMCGTQLPGAAQVLLLLRRNAKLLLLLFLLAFTRWGAMLIPVVLGMEGALLGMTFGGVFALSGKSGLLLLSLLQLPRLLLVVPYGFLLGSWAWRQSLEFGMETRRDVGGVLLITVLAVLLAAALECTLSRFGCAAYSLKFGV